MYCGNYEIKFWTRVSYNYLTIGRLAKWYHSSSLVTHITPLIIVPYHWLVSLASCLNISFTHTWLHFLKITPFLLQASTDFANLFFVWNSANFFHKWPFCALDDGHFIDCIFFYFSKAFDLVSHHLLYQKLRNLNIDPRILAWIKNFLTDRSQFVTANDYDSSFSPVTSGVPQGSVRGPLLFLIYINDLPNAITSHIRLFADDCVLYRVISSTADSSTLQSDLNEVTNWCDNWPMRLNTNKCKMMRISQRTNLAETLPTLYTIQGQQLEIATTT